MRPEKRKVIYFLVLCCTVNVSCVISIFELLARQLACIVRVIYSGVQLLIIST